MTRIAAAATVFAALLVPAVATPAAAWDHDVVVKRAAVDTDPTIVRTNEWIANPRPYSQQAYSVGADGKLWRTDCSGFVSMALNLSRSYSTRTLPEVTHPIAKESLRVGDILLAPDLHVVLFVRWTDAGQTAYVGREQTSTWTPNTVERTIPYPYFTNVDRYYPARKGL